MKEWRNREKNNVVVGGEGRCACCSWWCKATESDVPHCPSVDWSSRYANYVTVPTGRTAPNPELQPSSATSPQLRTANDRGPYELTRIRIPRERSPSTPVSNTSPVDACRAAAPAPQWPHPIPPTRSPSPASRSTPTANATRQRKTSRPPPRRRRRPPSFSTSRPRSGR